MVRMLVPCFRGRAIEIPNGHEKSENLHVEDAKPMAYSPNHENSLLDFDTKLYFGSPSKLALHNYTLLKGRFC